MPNEKKVYAAIVAVTEKLSKEGISKDRKNEQQGYKFRGIDDVYNALAPFLAAAKLCILPNVTERALVERTTAKGNAIFYVTVKVDFAFVSAEDGSEHHVITYGEAMDTADKATNKAMSAAYKYACMQAFCIPTEGDNDADAKTHDIKPAAPKSVAGAAWDALDEDERSYLQGIADAVLAEYLDKEAYAEAVAYIESKHLDAEERVALWSRFDSKHRAAMKAVATATRKAA